MELRRYLAILSKRWPLIVATVIVALAVSYLATPRKAIYTAQSTIVVGPRQYSVATGTGTKISSDQLIPVAILINTYSALIPTAPVARDAIARTHVPRSVAQVISETLSQAVPNTQLLRVTVSDPNPAIAQRLATGVANAFVAKVYSFKPDQAATAGSLPTVPVYVFQPAGLPTAPLPDHLKSHLVIAGVFGLLAALALVVVLEYLDVAIKSVEDAERRLQLPVLGVIPYQAGADVRAGSGRSGAEVVARRTVRDGDG